MVRECSCCKQPTRRRDGYCTQCYYEVEYGAMCGIDRIGLPPTKRDH